MPDNALFQRVPSYSATKELDLLDNIPSQELTLGYLSFSNEELREFEKPFVKGSGKFKAI